MRKLLLSLTLLSAALLLPPSSRAQFVVTGQGCGAPGLSAIANDGTPVVCRGNPLVWTAVGGSSSGSSSGPAGPNYILASAFGVNGTGNIVLDASWSNGVNPANITCPNNDCNFTSADTGKSCYGVSTTGVATAPLGTFTFTSAQAGTCSGLTTGSASTNGTFAWFVDNTAFLDAATAALYALPHCGTLVLPGGRIFTAHGSGPPPAACQIGVAFAGEQAGTVILGQGRNTTFIHPMPNFNFSTCTSGVCWWNTNGSNYKAFTIDGLGLTLSGVSTAPVTSLFLAPSNNTVEDVYLQNWANAASNSPIGFNITGQGAYAIGVQVSAWGSPTNRFFCNGPNVTLIDNFSDGGFGAGGTCYGYGNGWSQSANASTVTVTGKYFAYGDYNFGTNFTQPILDMQAGGTAYLFGWTTSGSVVAGGFGIYFRAANSIVHSCGSSIVGGATGGALNGAASAGQFYDDCPNTFTGPISGYTGKFFNSASLTGTAQTSANWSVPAGSGAGQWGTTPSVATCTGNSKVQQCTITVGSGTVGANPIVTITFPTSAAGFAGFFTAPSCDAKMIGGTATLANFTTGTVTATTAPFTYTGTPAASSTIVLKVSCDLP